MNEMLVKYRRLGYIFDPDIGVLAVDRGEG
jgi:hypothetical protein